MLEGGLYPYRSHQARTAPGEEVYWGEAGEEEEEEGRKKEKERGQTGWGLCLLFCP